MALRERDTLKRKLKQMQAIQDQGAANQPVVPCKDSEVEVLISMP